MKKQCLNYRSGKKLLSCLAHRNLSSFLRLFSVINVLSYLLFFTKEIVRHSNLNERVYVTLAYWWSGRAIWKVETRKRRRRRCTTDEEPLHKHRTISPGYPNCHVQEKYFSVSSAMVAQELLVRIYVCATIELAFACAPNMWGRYCDSDPRKETSFGHTTLRHALTYSKSGDERVTATWWKSASRRTSYRQRDSRLALYPLYCCVFPAVSSLFLATLVVTCSFHVYFIRYCSTGTSIHFAARNYFFEETNLHRKKQILR